MSLEGAPNGEWINAFEARCKLLQRGTVEALNGIYFQLKALGPTKVKGVSEPVNVYEVTGLGPLRTRLQRSASRGLSKFVGRAGEMEAMRCALELPKTGRGQIVAAVGEPGVGKSRLFFEFKARSRSGCLVFEADSVSHGKASAYLPVIELLKMEFGLYISFEPTSQQPIPSPNTS